jgi:hypothetical protein
MQAGIFAFVRAAAIGASGALAGLIGARASSRSRRQALGAWTLYMSLAIEAPL